MFILINRIKPAKENSGKKAAEWAQISEDAAEAARR